MNKKNKNRVATSIGYLVFLVFVGLAMWSVHLVNNWVPSSFYDPFCAVDQVKHGIDVTTGASVTEKFNIDCKNFKEIK